MNNQNTEFSENSTKKGLTIKALNKEQQSKTKVHYLTRKAGDQTYFFTKDEKHCLCIDYNPRWDFGNGSPSGAHLSEIEIHTNNAFNFENIPEIQLDKVPECILE